MPPKPQAPPAGPEAGMPPADLRPDEMYDWQLSQTLNRLQKLYRENIQVLEERFDYNLYKPSWFAETVVQKKPFVTFLGPFSAGKSTFINYLMQSNYLLTGPQPVTDKFTVIMHGEDITPIPGRVLVSDSSQPFRGLNQFGDSFVECFGGLLAPHPILKSVSLIDTPGVLEAAGDVHARRYDYIKVCRWFIERSDLVFFMFDPTKLDAGIELRLLFKHALKGFESRTRIVLNKADTVGPQELMRVYGALFWNLSNLIATTEPPRVYVSSFWDRPYKPGTNHQLFTDEKCDLLYDLVEVVPLQSLDKRVTSVLRRAQEVLHHVLVCAKVRSSMPKFFGKDKAKKQAIDNLPQTFEDLAMKYKLSVHDFGDPEAYAAFFGKIDVMELPDMEKCEKKGWLAMLKHMIEVEMPMMLKPIKSGPVIDPKDRKHMIMLQRDYQSQLESQLAGQQGKQGGMGESAAPAFRQGTMEVPREMYQQQPQYGMQQQPMQQQRGGMPPQQMGMGGASGGMDMNQMMMMMQMMQQQQQPQPQYQQLAPPPPQQQAGGAPQMTPEQMAMMMQMMQQQQSGQYQAVPSGTYQ
jgi:GTPase SAR1 family protein